MSKKTIDECVRHSLEAYFKDLGGTPPHNMYEMMIRVVEKPLLEVVMHEAEQNQSKAAEWLGLNRNTLRKKLLEHKLAEGYANGAPESKSANGKAGASKTEKKSLAKSAGKLAGKALAQFAVVPAAKAGKRAAA
jgi:Fis family transcriptional regulator, factor for inversion stimulation protein